MAGHPKNIVLLTCDAPGVMPPIARLTPEQAMYHFISGYTSKVGGTEIGLGKEPEITFSACFGAPFMVHLPSFYADLLNRKILRYDANCWLINTGWVGGPYGIGKRISIAHTRAAAECGAVRRAAGRGILSSIRSLGSEVPENLPRCAGKRAVSGGSVAQQGGILGQVSPVCRALYRQFQEVRGGLLAGSAGIWAESLKYRHLRFIG